MKRRSFIKSALGLAALTVAPKVLVSPSVVDSVQAGINSGVIEGKTFYLHEPVIIDIPNVTMRGCRFIAMADMDCMMEIKSNNTVLHDCTFDLGNRVDTGISITGESIGSAKTNTFKGIKKPIRYLLAASNLAAIN